MDTGIMTIDEVAALLRVSERTVYDWAQKGEIPGGKLGTSWRFVRGDIEAWVTRRLTPRNLSIPPESAAALSAVLSPQRAHRLDVVCKEQALDVLVGSLARVPGVLSHQELGSAIAAREALMSTGIGFGIGVPHARLGGVKNVHAAVGVCATPLTDYESLDGLPVSIIVMIVAGRDQHALYIKTLSNVAAVLKDSAVREALCAAESSEALFAILTNREV